MLKQVWWTLKPGIKWFQENFVECWASQWMHFSPTIGSPDSQASAWKLPTTAVSELCCFINQLVQGCKKGRRKPDWWQMRMADYVRLTAVEALRKDQNHIWSTSEHALTAHAWSRRVNHVYDVGSRQPMSGSLVWVRLVFVQAWCDWVSTWICMLQWPAKFWFSMPKSGVHVILDFMKS